jgi:hypothetical protein
VYVLEIVRESAQLEATFLRMGAEVRNAFGSSDLYLEKLINAERIAQDPDTGPRIAPDPGTVSACVFPEHDDVDVITGIEPGSVVSPFYDNLLAQLVARGKNRLATIDTLRTWLSDVRIEGIGSIVPLLRLIVGEEQFTGGKHDTGYVGRLFHRTRVEDLVAQVKGLRGPRSRLDRSRVAIEGSDELKVIARAPCVFYSAPGPGHAEFAAVGDRVRVDTTLCLVEAMKLFEELSLERYNAEGPVVSRRR